MRARKAFLHHLNTASEKLIWLEPSWLEESEPTEIAEALQIAVHLKDMLDELVLDIKAELRAAERE